MPCCEIKPLRVLEVVDKERQQIRLDVVGEANIDPVSLGIDAERMPCGKSLLIYPSEIAQDLSEFLPVPSCARNNGVVREIRCERAFGGGIAV
jgi:hypothetical protein